jgi:DNA-binding transcriptional MerR regulator
MAQHEPIRKSKPGMTHSEIPDKLYFRIGEVAKLCEVQAYVLRFWESEFPQLKPHKGGTGQRLYRKRDVEMALRIKRLLYDEGYTIPGARQIVKSELKSKEPQLELIDTGVPDIRHLQGLRRELQEIVAMLSRPAGDAPPAKAVHSFRTPKRPSAVRPQPAPSPAKVLFENTGSDPQFESQPESQLDPV